MQPEKFLDRQLTLCLLAEAYGCAKRGVAVHERAVKDEFEVPVGCGAPSAHVDPLNVSYRAVAPVSSPTARQFDGPEHEAESLSSSEWVWGRLGGVVCAHMVPVSVSPRSVP